MLKKKVLFFGDFGVDDIAALIYAHYEKKLDIVGVVAEYGNVSTEQAIKNATYIRKVTGENYPIFAGASRPLTGKQPTYYPDIHGEAGMGPIIPDGSLKADALPLHRINPLIEQHQDQLTIINAGRMTSLSTSFVLYPEVMRMIKEIILVGGAFFVPGNVTPVSEANFHGDPYAANLTLSLAKNVKILPMNVTRQAVITNEMIDYIQRYHKKGSASLLEPILRYYTNYYTAAYPNIPGSPLYDVLGMSAVVHEELFHYQKAPVTVIVDEGESFGQSIADFRQLLKDKADYPEHEIALHFDYRAFISDFLKNVTGHPFANGKMYP